ncbi:E3 ubiquitin-protein ligase NRDP1-like isoform X2 [Varroa jacobsoni]|uniref:E3 ubiquitin-protein ligase NRDP1 n=2 Tax=Varroa TaxID=62624 RepID=A0A7M7KAS2_VARDE|nr:E3 ubiquitin-protein ligase NRDP1-like isoform X1 [Varroa destructor]XP_022664111.1 E3 ubiquitin-protein ligase NRDP1-like isoform X1 [Varroa destructor]XP_022690972.1 E3 ubiquitin-protein ligase NRDP1-like isoform X2 [Varroa jacobsoni]XP_022690973.1 E3 ubiquitin-protein ligase NRDP1-like isoform X2 [Varroa jacobsoni]
MGYELARFVSASASGSGAAGTPISVDEELVCPICSGVLQEPVHTPQCEHAFCKECIHNWIDRKPSCPIDRSAITIQELKPVPRILRTLLSRLTLSCKFAEHGCTEVVKLDRLESHETVCEFNPGRPVTCTEGCDLVIPKDELRDHNCIKELRALALRQQARVAELERQISSQLEEICRLKDLRASAVPHTLNSADFQDRIEQLALWSSNLNIARVTRWGGMISTPDRVLQNMVKRALIDSGCPLGVINELIENAHERKWPRGLDTLETRQRNRRAFENFVCKRIPGKQAVVALACDNMHMGDDMMVQPGLIMIFAHGIE